MQVRVLSLAILNSCDINQSHALSNPRGGKGFRLGVSVTIQPLIVSIALNRTQSESGVGAHISANECPYECQRFLARTRGQRLVSAEDKALRVKPSSAQSSNRRLACPRCIDRTRCLDDAHS